MDVGDEQMTRYWHDGAMVVRNLISTRWQCQIALDSEQCPLVYGDS